MTKDIDKRYETSEISQEREQLNLFRSVETLVTVCSEEYIQVFSILEWRASFDQLVMVLSRGLFKDLKFLLILAKYIDHAVICCKFTLAKEQV